MHGISFIEVCPHLDWHQFLLGVRKAAGLLAQGPIASRFQGEGVDYLQSRPYRPGDPVRQIDWRATAKASKLCTKEYETTRRKTVYIALDRSASMCVTSVPSSSYEWAPWPSSKYAYSVQLAGALAMVALDQLGPVGLVSPGEPPLSVRPSLARQQVYHWLNRLRRYRPDQALSLGLSLRELLASGPSSYFVIVLSDLHDPNLVDTLKKLGRKHECVCLVPVDPAERGRLRCGLFLAREAETGRLFGASGRSRWLTDPPDRALTTARVPVYRFGIDQDFLPGLRAFFRMRALPSRAAR
jgi:uncharacterized protein (DUF58 family)